MTKFVTQGGIFRVVSLHNGFAPLVGGGGKEEVIENLKRIKGIGDKTAEEYYEKGIRSIADVAKSPIVSFSIRMYAKYFHDIQKNIPVKLAENFNNWVKSKLLERKVGGFVEVFLVGAHRRDVRTSHDIDILITYNSDELGDEKNFVMEIYDLLMDEDKFILPLEYGSKMISILAKLKKYMRAVDIYTCPVEEAGAALIRRTGPKEFVVAIQKFASLIGYQMRADGLYDKGGNRIAGQSEKKIFDKLGLKYITPFERSDPSIHTWLYEEGNKRRKIVGSITNSG